MTGSDATEPLTGLLAPRPPVNQIMEAKLRRPPSRSNWVPRERLTEAMDRAVRHPVTLVAAPAGYGKTTLAAQWLDGANRPPTAWVSLDKGDNDPDRLWSDVALALEQAGCLLPLNAPSHGVGRTSGEAPGAVLPAILDALAAMPEAIVLVLDDFHFVHEPSCHEQVEFMLEHLPVQAHLIIMTRSDPGLRLGRFRAAGDLAEIRANDLAFTTGEVVELLAQSDVRLADTTVSALLEHTEGWPAGVYLATLSLSGRPDPDDFVRQFSKGNRFVGDYLTEEVLSRGSERVREFITTVSILDRFTASLCDQVVGIADSAAILRDLERSNLFLVPLDEEREWFRFHHLFAAVARSELDASRPGGVPTLHARAAEWFRARGHIQEAVVHSLAAGNTAAAAQLIQGNWLAYVDAGRAATVLGWLESLGPAAAASDPAAGVATAWLAAFTGDEMLLSESLDALERFHDHGPLPDGTRSVESAIAMIHGLFGYGGPVAMMTGAQRAVELETDSHSPHYAVAQVTLGHAAYVAGDLDEAITPLTRASLSDQAPGVIRALALAVESLVEHERGDLARSRECAELAMRIVDAQSLRSMPQTSLAFTALGQAQAAAGKIDDGLNTLEMGLAIRRRTSAHGPWGMIHHLLVTARIAAEAGRFELARDLAADVNHRMKRFSDGMVAMHARRESVSQLLRAHEADDALDEPLTARELDVLRLLQDGLSLNEIAGDLYLTANTVKTHVRAVYRKLGAHSKADAVRSARRRSLL